MPDPTDADILGTGADHTGADYTRQIERLLSQKPHSLPDTALDEWVELWAAIFGAVAPRHSTGDH